MTSAQQGQNFDPFEQGDGVPAVSFKDAPIGSIVTIQIDDDSKWLQQRNYETGELDYWDARPNETPNPKMAAVVTGIVQPTAWAQQSGQAGERRSIWAGKPSSMFTAIQTAKRNAGGGSPVPILAGGTLDIAFVGEEPNKANPRLNNIKQYQARYTPPPAGFGQQDAFEGNQAFAGAPAPAAQQPAAQPFAQAAAPAVAQVGTFAGPPQQQFAQQAPAAQPFQQPQAPAAAAPQPQAPAGNPWGGQPSGFGQQQAPAPQAQQPAMAGAPAGGDPWSSAPSQEVPNF